MYFCHFLPINFELYAVLIETLIPRIIFLNVICIHMYWASGFTLTFNAGLPQKDIFSEYMMCFLAKHIIVCNIGCYVVHFLDGDFIHFRTTR